MRGTGRVKNMFGLKSEKIKNTEYLQNWWCSDKKVCIAIFHLNMTINIPVEWEISTKAVACL